MAPQTKKNAIAALWSVFLLLAAPVGVLASERFDDFEAYNTKAAWFADSIWIAGNQNFGEITTSFGYSGTHSLQSNSTFAGDTVEYDYGGSSTDGFMSAKIYVPTVTGVSANNNTSFIAGFSINESIVIRQNGKVFCTSAPVPFDCLDGNYVQIGWNDLSVEWHDDYYVVRVNGHEKGYFGGTPVGSISLVTYDAIGTAAYIDDVYINTDYVVGTETIPNLFYVTPYISIINPQYGTTTASTTVNIKIHYTTPLSLDYRPETQRHYEVRDAVTDELEFSYNFTLPENTGEDIIIDQDILLATGSKMIYASYVDNDGNLYSNQANSFFNVIDNTFLAATGITTPSSNTAALTQINCTFYDVGCQFQKAIVFLFYPTETVLNKFANLWQGISTKKPFGYITVTINQLKSLDATGGAYFNLGTVPFMDSIFTPFRVLVSSILWAIFFIYWYHNRLKTLDI